MNTNKTTTPAEDTKTYRKWYDILGIAEDMVIEDTDLYAELLQEEQSFDSFEEPEHKWEVTNIDTPANIQEDIIAIVTGHQARVPKTDAQRKILGTCPRVNQQWDKAKLKQVEANLAKIGQPMGIVRIKKHYYDQDIRREQIQSEEMENAIRRIAEGKIIFLVKRDER